MPVACETPIEYVRLMSGDESLLALGDQEFEAIVAEAYRLRRTGDVLSLATSALAHSTLVEPCFLVGEPVTTDVRGRAMQSLLQWAAERLQPGGSHSWTATHWRSYNILMSLFIHGKRVSELAELMAISEQTLYQLRGQAIAGAARVLREELRHPADAAGRRVASLANRYARHSPDEQKLLRLVAVFEHQIPASLLYTLGEEAGVADVQACVRGLVSANLLVSTDQGTDFLARPDMRQYLLSLLLPEERRRWHYAAGEHYRAQDMFLDAAGHFRLAGAHESAAQAIIDHWRDILDNLQIEELRDCLREFRQKDVSPLAWARLKIIAGEVAEALDDVDTALAEYQQALGATDPHTKALAYYRRAKVLELKDIDESLAHYGYGIQFLTERSPRDPLLTRMYIDMAWIFIQERQDFAKAEANLNYAERHCDSADRETWADLHNAWGELFYRRGDLGAAIEHHWQGWLAAKEINNAERQMRAAHNLGQIYVELGKYDQGLDYLQEGKQLAVKAGNRKLEAVCERSIGVCRFWLRDYAGAIECYRRARDIFVEMKNDNWLAHTCCDLAEAHAELGDVAESRRYHAEGRRIAESLGGERLLGEFDALARKYPALSEQAGQLSERQLKALEFARASGAVTNRDYQRITGMSQKQTVRDLTDLVHRGLLVRVGNGRATRYIVSPGHALPQDVRPESAGG